MAGAGLVGTEHAPVLHARPHPRRLHPGPGTARRHAPGDDPRDRRATWPASWRPCPRSRPSTPRWASPRRPWPASRNTAPPTPPASGSCCARRRQGRQDMEQVKERLQSALDDLEGAIFVFREEGVGPARDPGQRRGRLHPGHRGREIRGGPGRGRRAAAPPARRSTAWRTWRWTGCWATPPSR